MYKAKRKVWYKTFPALLALTFCQYCWGQRRAVNLSPSSRRPPYSDSILVGNTLYIAGLQGTNSTGVLPSGGFAPQVRATLENFRRVVRAAGFRMRDVVSVNVYLTDMHDFGVMNKIYTTYFPDPKPARTTVQVGALSKGALIEIAGVAVKKN